MHIKMWLLWAGCFPLLQSPKLLSVAPAHAPAFGSVQ